MTQPKTRFLTKPIDMGAAVSEVYIDNVRLVVAAEPPAALLKKEAGARRKVPQPVCRFSREGSAAPSPCGRTGRGATAGSRKS